jgi:hypothetical protein
MSKTSRAIIFLFLMWMFHPLFSQQTFEKIISHHEDQVIYDAVADEDGNFLLVGSISTIDIHHRSGYIVKLDEYGNIQ